jgi:protein TonB
MAEKKKVQKKAAEPPPPAAQQQMFSNLIASKPKKERGGPTAIATSFVLHTVLIALALWATSRVREVIADDSPITQLIEVQEDPPPPPPPPPPPTNDPPPVTTEIVDVPKGFQTLAPPTIVPPNIPPPTAGPAVTAADFTGEGVVGGRSTGKVTAVTAEDIEAAPTFTPMTVPPKLLNQDEAVRAMQRFYPPLLRDAGIGGTVKMWFLIDENGRVMQTRVKEPSGQPSLDEAAHKVGEIMRFSPALNRDQKVKVWVEVPIIFRTQ